MNISLKANDFMRREQGQRQEQILWGQNRQQLRKAVQSSCGRIYQ